MVLKCLAGQISYRDNCSDLPQWSISVANLIGLPEPGFIWLVMPFVAIGLYFLLIKLMIEIAFAAKVEYEDTRGPLAALWWIVAYTFVTILFVLNLIHLVITLGAAYSVMSTFRDWWHAGK